tara:strand:- start:972 stop:1355 length:384 start_codon:yes stop_codon:yes gene_type:complete
MQIKNKTSNKSLGIVFSIFFLILSLYPLLNGDDVKITLLIVSLIFLILGLIKSEILTPLNIIWFRFGIFLGKFISPLVMGIIFFLVITPTAFIMRLRGKNLLILKKNNNKSYWIKTSKIKSKMKNQF